MRKNSTLISLLLLFATPALGWSQGSTPISGEELPPGASIEERLGITYSTGFGPFASVVRLEGPPSFDSRVWHITFDDPGTGRPERFLLAQPTAPLTPAPLLVMFHGDNVTEWDCYVNTPIMIEAVRRGWYVVAPLGAHNRNYGITYAQTNIEVVLDWVDQFFDLDPARVYGLGFSMGGGAAASYAARHQDPAHPRFAALVNHTGSTSLSHTYWKVKDPWLFDLPEMFGGSPTLFPFEYARCSVFDLATDGVTIDPATDMARNLVHVPVLDVVATKEPVATFYLRTQTLALHDWMGTLGGIETLLEPDADEHSWATLDARLALSFLAQHTLTVPTEGIHRVLADRDGWWFHFEVHQVTAGAFTPFRFAVQKSQNRVVIDQSENLERLVIDTASLGLDTGQDLQVILGTFPEPMQTITVLGYPNPPYKVRRNGYATPDYKWDPVGESVNLYEYDDSNDPHWTIVP